MQRVRRELEDKLLDVPHVTFVSVAFKQADQSTVLVTLGTGRPDLVGMLVNQLVAVVADVLHAHLERGAWLPEFQILKGRAREP